MLKGKNILCFANDWHNDPTSKHQVMKILARENRVLWINSIALRRPDFSKRDLSRIAGKLRSWMRGMEEISPNLHVFTPIVLPFPASTLTRKFNGVLLRLALWRCRRLLGMKEFQLWTFLPSMVELAGRMGEERLVYYCVDEWSKFSFIDGEAMRSMETRLLELADVVFVTSDRLYRDKARFNSKTHLIEHGVDYEHFSRARREKLPEPEDMRLVKKPTLGFFGLIHEWIDLDLIEYLARSRPQWSIVLIGKCSVDVGRLKQYANVHLLGQKPYQSLPAYCRMFDVGLIPFAVNELTANVNPIKLREYLAAGVAVVSTRLPECEKYRDLVHIAGTHQEFAEAVERALVSDTRQERDRRSTRMAVETWESKVEELSRRVEEG